MKFKTTKKDMRQSYNTILSVGYCSLQALLNYESPIAYSAGTYGWSCDYYDIDGVIICTGYNTIGQDVDYKLIREYEKKAEAVKYNPDYKETDKKLAKLTKDFIKKAVK